MATIDNEWLTLPNLYKGIQVKRKFAGLDTFVELDDNVKYCHVKYWQREFYPNGDIIKTELKFYALQDLAYTEEMIEEILYKMEPLPVLSGFIQSIGQPGIVDPARDTLMNDIILPPESENGYPLRRDTREKIPVEQEI